MRRKGVEVPAWRQLAGKLGIEPAQIIPVVDIVPYRQAMDLEIDFTGALERLRGHPLGAPGNIFEHAAVSGLEAQQIIAAVGRGAEDGTIARARKHGGALNQKRGRQSGTIGIEDNRRPVAAREYLLDRVAQ